MVDRLQNQLRATGLDCVDLTADLALTWRLDADDLSRPRGHWSPAGNARIADRLVRHLGE